MFTTASGLTTLQSSSRRISWQLGSYSVAFVVEALTGNFVFFEPRALSLGVSNGIMMLDAANNMNLTQSLGGLQIANPDSVSPGSTKETPKREPNCDTFLF